MTWMPFICLGTGLLIGCASLPRPFFRAVDAVVNVALILLMAVIGMNVGVNDEVMGNLGRIGLNCALVCLAAIAGSVALTVILERTVLPLSQLAQQIRANDGAASIQEGEAPQDADTDEKKSSSPLLWLIPLSIVAGTLAGYFLVGPDSGGMLDGALLCSLVVLYTGVGISMGENRSVFAYLKVLGVKVLLISLAVFVGSVTGGVIMGLAAGVTPETALIASSGMGYYSITGAFMTQNMGAEAGIYGFMVNVMRDFFTVLLLPLLIRISKGSAIASGAAGNMDTMLVPVTRLVGPELGLVALIVGVTATFAVPFIQPILFRLAELIN